MAFSYTGPASSDADRLRFLVGDTSAIAHLLSDEEVAYLLSEAGSVDAAVVPALESMIAVASQRVDWGSGQERESASQRVTGLRRLRADMIAQGYPEPSSRQRTSGVRILTRPPADRTDYDDV